MAGTRAEGPAVPSMDGAVEARDGLGRQAVRLGNRQLTQPHLISQPTRLPRHSRPG